MKRILGLDLGTTSIGWAVVDQAENENEKSDIIKLGVRVNPLSVDERDNYEKGKSITTTADRTQKRGMRRNLQRYKLRRDNLVSILKREHFIEETTQLGEDGPGTTFQTLRLRAKAADEAITLPELARVLLMINKKRGYKSNRKANNQEEGQLIDGMSVARTLYDEELTPGQYVCRLLANGKNYAPSFYRSDLMTEYDRIWDEQRKYYPDILTEEFKAQLAGRGAKDVDKIFYAKYKVHTAEIGDRKLRRKTIYRWRVEALKQQCPIEEVACVLGNMGTELKNCSGYLGSIGDHSKELYFNNMTVGQYLVAQLDRDPHYRVKDRVYYRQDYLDEFEKIWETQAQFHPELTPELKTEIRDVVIFYQRKLKSKKGLLAYCELEGREIIVTEGDKRRKVMTGPRVCPKSSPLFQDCKVWQTVNNVEVRDSKSGNSTLLTREQRQLLHDELTGRHSMKKAEALKLLGYKAKQHDLNYDELPGNTTMATMLEGYRTIADWSGHDVEDFNKLNYSQKMQLLSGVFRAIGASTDILRFDYKKGTYTSDALFKLWHLIYSYEDDNTATGNGKLIEHIAAMTGLSKEYASALAAITFADDYGSLSSKAIDNIMPHLIAGNKYSEACALAGYNHSRQSLTREQNDSRELAKQLPVLAKNSLRNPVVEKILNQMVHVVNACMEQYGKPDEHGVKRFDEIHVEMARNLKQSAKQREEATKAMRSRTRENEEIMELLRKEFNIAHPSRNDILRYRLYMELEPNGFKTLYTGTDIKREELFGRNFDIEHIIPQAVLFDDSFSNKTLETRAANIEKGKMTAIDYVRKIRGDEGVEQYKRTVEDLFGKTSRAKCKKLLTEGDKLPEDFLNRDLNDTRYISSKAREMLLEVTRTVVPTLGSITDTLREDWGLVDVMKDLNWDKYAALGLTETYRNRDGHEVRRIKDWSKRNDHRHHAMDALAVAFTRLEHTQYLNSLSARDEAGEFTGNMYALNRLLKRDGRFVPPIPRDDLRALVKLRMEEILVSIKAKNKVATKSVNRARGTAVRQVTLTPRTQLHNETVYGRQRRYVTRVEKVDGSFDYEKIMTVASKLYREALLQRLTEHGGDAVKAFTKKNALAKNPIYLNEEKSRVVPDKVKTVTLQGLFTIRKAVDKDLKVDKVVDAGVRSLLKQRIAEYGSADKAFSNLEENPIWLNEEKGIAVKRVTISGVSVASPLHDKHDKHGNKVLDKDGNTIPADYVSTSNNHHVAIYQGSDGNLQECVVSYFEAIARINAGLPVVDKDYNAHLGWKFLFTMKRNEYFVFPDSASGFYPEEMDLTDPTRLAEISKHLYRVQKLATGDYFFRHHLETTVESTTELKNITWIRCGTNGLIGIVKVRINHVGQIVQVGEY